MRSFVLLWVLGCYAEAKRTGDMRDPTCVSTRFGEEGAGAPAEFRNIRVRRHAPSHHLWQKGPKPAPGAEN